MSNHLAVRRGPVRPSAELQRMRHSCAHLLAAAVHSLRPGAKFGVGPATANGFFYDVDVTPVLTESDLGLIEERMRSLAAQRLAFERSEVSFEAAIALLEERGQPYKVDLVRLLRAKGSAAVSRETGDDDAVAANAGTVGLYRLGAFFDLCKGPHVAHTGEIGAFRLRSIAGAYWRGDERNPQLQRVHALCFATPDELDAAVARIELAAQRDHRKIGRELGLFAFSDAVGAGLPLWLPRGTVLRDELEHLAKGEERHASDGKHAGAERDQDIACEGSRSGARQQMPGLQHAEKREHEEHAPRQHLGERAPHLAALALVQSRDESGEARVAQGRTSGGVHPPGTSARVFPLCDAGLCRAVAATPRAPRQPSSGAAPAAARRRSACAAVRSARRRRWRLPRRTTNPGSPRWRGRGLAIGRG